MEGNKLDNGKPTSVPRIQHSMPKQKIERNTFLYLVVTPHRYDTFMAPLPFHKKKADVPFLRR